MGVGGGGGGGGREVYGRWKKENMVNGIPKVVGTGRNKKQIVTLCNIFQRKKHKDSSH